ncbi:Uma2 family endonuclease [[Limnothrix rosea] IAM M-220]|uniref:Uma2 family endonuclease n=1 Tax=[Limnothrix rosea] IAM M-220 TaxID=454133 RepID=UPI000964E7B7|nr:Uma2 family endonuclease [[Limnothrix rosea] IAM M-220]OKH18961.1 hypothetical protein NIES208_04170 [[Limnothrix rosea] IAM M-220]
MIAAAELPRKMTPEEYLEWEATQNIRYEYVDGEIYAMTGGSVTHNRIALNLYFALRPHLKKRGCYAAVSDVKVQDVESERYFYPDLAITCNASDQKNNQLIQYPTTIVEVLSPSNANYDKDFKLKLYRQIASLQEYILIDSQRVKVEMYQRQSGKMWGYTDYELNEILTIPSIEFDCPVQLLYEDAIFDTVTAEE